MHVQSIFHRIVSQGIIHQPFRHSFTLGLFQEPYIRETLPLYQSLYFLSYLYKSQNHLILQFSFQWKECLKAWCLCGVFCWEISNALHWSGLALLLCRWLQAIFSAVWAIARGFRLNSIHRLSTFLCFNGRFHLVKLCFSDGDLAGWSLRLMLNLTFVFIIGFFRILNI